MRHLLSQLASLAGRSDLTAAQLDELVEPLKFLFARLAAKCLYEMPEVDLFHSPSARDERYYVSRAMIRKGSLSSQLSIWLRSIYRNAQVLTSSTASTTQLRGCFVAHKRRSVVEGGGIVFFIWRNDIHRPRSKFLRECRTSVAKAIAPVEELLDAQQKSFALPTSWGALARAVPVRHLESDEVIFPCGAGFGRSSVRPTDRPWLSAESGAQLTSFFHDEPLSQAYSAKQWLLIGPGRLFAVLPAKPKSLTAWLHAEHERERLAALASEQVALQESKRERYEQYERKKRRDLGKPRKRRKTEYKRHRPHQTKPISLQALYEILERLSQKPPPAG